MPEERLDIIVEAIDRSTASMQRINNHFVRFSQSVITQNRHMRNSIHQTTAAIQQQSAVLQATSNRVGQYLRNMQVQNRHIIQRLNDVRDGINKMAATTQKLPQAHVAATRATQAHTTALGSFGSGILKTIDGYRSLIARVAVGVVVFRGAVAAIGGLFQAMRSGTQQVESYEQSILGMTAALVSMDQRTTQTNVGKMFQDMEGYVRSLYKALRLLDIQFSGSHEDLIALAREFAMYGVTVDINNKKHLEGLRGIGEAIRALAPGLNFQLQASQLIRAVVLGIRDEMDQVTRGIGLAGAAGDALRKRLAAAATPVEYMNTFWESIGTHTAGFIAMAPRMQYTLEASMSSLQTMWSILSQSAFRQVWKDVIEFLQRMRALIVDSQGELTALGQAIENEIIKQWERVKEALREAFGGKEIPDFVGLIRIVGNSIVWFIETINKAARIIRFLKSLWDMLPGPIRSVIIALVLLRGLLGFSVVAAIGTLGSKITKFLPILTNLRNLLIAIQAATLGWKGLLLLLVGVGVLEGFRRISKEIERIQKKAFESLHVPKLSLRIKGEEPPPSGLTPPRRLAYEFAPPPKWGAEYVDRTFLSRPKSDEKFMPQPRVRGGPEAPKGVKRDPAVDALRDYLTLQTRLRELGEITAEEEIRRLRTVGMAHAAAIKDKREREFALLDLRVKIYKWEQEQQEESTTRVAKSRIASMQILEKMGTDAAEMIRKMIEAGEFGEAERYIERYKDLLGGTADILRTHLSITKERVEKERELADILEKARLIEEFRAADAEERNRINQAFIDLAEDTQNVLQREIDLNRELDEIRRSMIIGERQQHEANVEAQQRRIKDLTTMAELLERQIASALQLEGVTTEQLQSWYDRLADIKNEIILTTAELEKLQEMMRIRTNPLAAWLAVMNEIRGRIIDWQQIFTDVVNGIQNAFQQLFSDILSGTKDFGESLLDFFRNIVNAIIQELAQLWALQIIKWLFGRGGIIPGGGGGSDIHKMARGGLIPAYAYGTPIAQGNRAGIYNKPTYIVGEGKNAEAVVPLPDNRSIPVRIEGGEKQPQPLDVRIKVVQVFDPRNIPRADPDEILAVVNADMLRGGATAKTVRKVIR